MALQVGFEYVKDGRKLWMKKKGKEMQGDKKRVGFVWGEFVFYDCEGFIIGNMQLIRVYFVQHIYMSS